MVEQFKQLIEGQYQAALKMLGLCIEQCPDSAWEQPVVNLAFCQASFHALFFTDLYLGLSVEAMRMQGFHQSNPDIFRDYEELEDREQTLIYDRPSIQLYWEHCREKVTEVMAAETEQSLQAIVGYGWWTLPRAEVHVYNIRHIQHHAAQLSLRLRLDHHEDVKYCRSGR